MKLSAYIVTEDTGFAPNPFGRYCTLACCKPTIRRCAKKNDIVIGIASVDLPKPGHLIYAMRVKCVLPYEEYWIDPRFANRKPTPKTAISRRGDNIWYKVGRKWRVVPGAFHDASLRRGDISGKNALIATEFFYFGRAAIRVPKGFQSILATTQGHKNTTDSTIINDFWNWVRSSAFKPGRIAEPCDFADDACRAQCSYVEEDDIEEE
jgi:hypothetical protein